MSVVETQMGIACSSTQGPLGGSDLILFGIFDRLLAGYAIWFLVPSTENRRFDVDFEIDFEN